MHCNTLAILVQVQDSIGFVVKTEGANCNLDSSCMKCCNLIGCSQGSKLLRKPCPNLPEASGLLAKMSSKALE